MDIPDGKKRVVISNIFPQIEGGRYPAKRVTGESITVTADIFSDGHDAVAASLLMRPKADEQWQEYPMKHVINDRWEATVETKNVGFYEYQVIGWIDHFTTWKKGLVRSSSCSYANRI